MAGTTVRTTLRTGQRREGTGHTLGSWVQAPHPRSAFIFQSSGPNLSATGWEVPGE